MTFGRTVSRLFLACALASAVTSCSRSPRSRQELTILAAASLRDAFTMLVRDFERSHPSVRVRLNLAGSQELRVQIESGLVADVFASADEKNVSALERQGLLAERHLFARNRLVVVVPATNPADVRSFKDLDHVPRLVLGAPEVPIGAYTASALDKMEASLGTGFRSRVEAHVRSRELNVRQVLSKVVLGEADAGIVYLSDARVAGAGVVAIEIPAELQVTAAYPVAILKSARQPEMARAWIELLLSESGQRALVAAGFEPVERR